MTGDQIRSIYYKLKLKTITIVITTVCGSYVTQVACVLVPVYTNQERNTQARGDSPHLSKGVPNKITLIRLSQGSLDRWRREKGIWKMVTEHYYYYQNLNLNQKIDTTFT